MKHKVYYLKTCNTSMRTLRELEPYLHDFEKQEIKTSPITPQQLDEMKSLSGSYESLFSRRARKYTAMGLKDKNLSENDYKNYLLQDYTFLKRPVFIVGDEIFIGNSKKNIEALTHKLQVNDR